MTARSRLAADVVIVGLGISTGPLIEALLADTCRASRIVLIDRGALWDYRTPERPHGPIEVHASSIPLGLAADHVVFTDPLGGHAKVPKWWAASRAGGGSLLWYGQLSRFRPSDLDVADRLARLLPDTDRTEVRDWPIAHDDLVRYYDEVERRLRPFGSSYGSGAGDLSDCAIFEERAHLSRFEVEVIDRLGDRGIAASVGPTCLGGRAWEQQPVDPRSLTRHPSGTPLAFRRNWYARIKDLVDERDDVEVISGAYVTRIVTERGRAVGVDAVVSPLSGDQRSIRIDATTIVLGCGALDTSRILLSSGLPNRNGLLGRRLTFTTEAVRYVLSDIPRSCAAEDRLAGVFANVTVRDGYELPGGRVGAVKGGKVSIYDAYEAEVPAVHVAKLRGAGSRLAEVLRDEQERYVLKLSFKGEALPSASKWVGLATARNRFGANVAHIHHAGHEHDLAVRAHASSVFDRITDAVGGTVICRDEDPVGPAVISAHQHGGAVFGTDRRDAVLDPNCEAFEARGLFVVDAAFMPTSGATNASLTVMANALRVADHLRSGRLTDAA